MAEAAAPPLLAVEGLCLRFGGLCAVDGVGFRVEAGEIVGLIGPNGAGKTSVFNGITGIYAPSAGSIVLDGRPLRRVWNWRNSLGTAVAAVAGGLLAALALNVQGLWQAAVIDLYAYQGAWRWTESPAACARVLAAAGAAWTWLPGLAVAGLITAARVLAFRRALCTPELAVRSGVARTFQNIRLFVRLSARDNVLVALEAARPSGVCWRWLGPLLRLPGWRRRQAALEAAAESLLTRCGLSEHADRPAGCLPYGHQRRLELARALATGPRLLLLDEPAAGMNPTETAALMALIRSLAADHIAVLLIEHDMRLVMGLCQRLVVLHHGEVLARGTPEAIRADPAVIAAYLGGT